MRAMRPADSPVRPRTAPKPSRCRQEVGRQAGGQAELGKGEAHPDLLHPSEAEEMRQLRQAGSVRPLPALPTMRQGGRLQALQQVRPILPTRSRRHRQGRRTEEGHLHVMSPWPTPPLGMGTGLRRVPGARQAGLNATFRQTPGTRQAAVEPLLRQAGARARKPPITDRSRTSKDTLTSANGRNSRKAVPVLAEIVPADESSPALTSRDGVLLLPHGGRGEHRARQPRPQWPRLQESATEQQNPAGRAASTLARLSMHSPEQEVRLASTATGTSGDVPARARVSQRGESISCPCTPPSPSTVTAGPPVGRWPSARPPPSPSASPPAGPHPLIHDPTRRRRR